MFCARPVRPLLAVAAFSVAACGSRGASTTNGAYVAAAPAPAAEAAATAAIAIAAGLTRAAVDSAAAAATATVDDAELEVIPRLMPDGRPAPGNVGKKAVAPQPDSLAMGAPPRAR
jgi:hypothetical protein